MPLEPDDISRLYVTHARKMTVFFARRTVDAEVAFELVAETFAAAIANRKSFRGSGPDREAAWLYAIARHELSGWYRRAKVERRALEQLGIEPMSMTEAEYERIEELADLESLRSELAAQLRELRDDQREALQLRVVEERPYPEVAAALGISEQTARARVSRGVRALAALLDQSTAGAIPRG